MENRVCEAADIRAGRTISIFTDGSLAADGLGNGPRPNSGRLADSGTAAFLKTLR
jgi:hypothetical protein